MGIIKSAERLTRRSYRRKIVTLGVSIFSALALMATGFASWVLSSDANKDVAGGVQVGVVQDASIEIVINSISGGLANTEGVENIFGFEPKKDDTAGVVKHSGNPGDPYEALEITIEATIKNVSNIGKLSVDMQVPAGVVKAAEAGYITLPSYSWVEGSAAASKIIVGTDTPGAATTHTATLANDGYTYVYNQESDSATFTFVIKCGWGTKFGGINPGIYYDTDGKGTDRATIQNNLDEMKALMHNTTLETYQTLSMEDRQKADLGMDDANLIGAYTFWIRAEVK